MSVHLCVVLLGNGQPMIKIEFSFDSKFRICFRFIYTLFHVFVYIIHYNSIKFRICILYAGCDTCHAVADIREFDLLTRIVWMHYRGRLYGVYSTIPSEFPITFCSSFSHDKHTQIEREKCDTF